MEVGMNSIVGYNFWAKRFKEEPESAICTNVLPVADREKSTLYEVRVVTKSMIHMILIRETKGKVRRIYLEENSIPKPKG